MKNVKGAATTGTRSTHASSSKVSSRYPSTRSSVPLEPIPHSRIHRVYLLAFLTRRFFRRSCPDASFYFLTSRRSPRPSTALFVADYSFREFFIRVYSPRYFFAKRTVRINGAVSAITRRVQILKKFSLGISRYRKIAGVENIKYLYRSFQPRKIQSCLNCTFNEGTKNIEFRS